MTLKLIQCRGVSLVEKGAHALRLGVRPEPERRYQSVDLLALDSDIKFIITGAVLLLAVTIDAVTRRQRQSAR